MRFLRFFFLVLFAVFCFSPLFVVDDSRNSELLTEHKDLFMGKRTLPSGLYLISDETMLREGTFPAFLEEVLRAGLRVVQLRAKSLSQEELPEIGREIRILTRRAGACFIVNDDAELAVRLGADGAHVGQEDLPPAEARKLLGENRILGLSTHTREQVLRAREEPVDYIGAGPIFPTATKPDAGPAAGPEFLQWAVRNSAVPVVAIGGITLDNLDAVLKTGVRSAAVISAISRSPNPAESARAFLSRLCFPGEPVPCYPGDDPAPGDFS